MGEALVGLVLKEDDRIIPMGEQNRLKKLTPIKRLSLVDKVEIHLLKYFKDNNFMPGDLLPREVEFADSMGVSRTVVREALVRLKILGLVESRKHKGMVFTEPDIISNFERVLDPMLLGNETLNNLFEMRLILEMGMAELLFDRKSGADVQELEGIVEAEESEKNRSDNFRLQTEIKFHGKLYEISGNDTLRRFQTLLLPIFEYVREQYPNRNKLYPKDSIKTHNDLVVELKQGDPKSFRNTMRSHLGPHFAKILKK